MSFAYVPWDFCCSYAERSYANYVKDCDFEIFTDTGLDSEMESSLTFLLELLLQFAVLRVAIFEACDRNLRAFQE